MEPRLRVRPLIDVDWVEVPAGTLHRGTPLEEIDAVVARHGDLGLPLSYFLKEAPRHSVEVPAFSISRTPVTRAQWNAGAAVVALPLAPADGPDLPVDGVAWDDAQLFCATLRDATGLPVHLPSEIQWERAARGDDTREYPWGDVWDPHAANTAAHGVGSPVPVGSLPRGASPFGVLDLAGNVDEWTRDLFAPYAGAPGGVPVVEAWANDRHVTRGGRYTQDRDLARCARRHSLYDDQRGAGVRLVLDADA